ncbi:MAG: carbohydrate kinase family protein, partial [Planctomycetota bacterium]
MAIDCLSCGILFADVVCDPIDRPPDAGQVAMSPRIQLCLGGCASNTALDLARLGVRVGVAGCVGDDVFGDSVVAALARGGVDTCGVHRIPQMNTACTMVVNVRGQDRRFICSVGANTQMTVDHIPEAWLCEARVLYLGGYLMLPGLESQCMVDLMRRARASGCKTVVDVVHIGNPNARAAVAQLLPETDVFLPNRDEAAALTGRDDPLEQAEAFRDLGACAVVITDGDNGSLLATDGMRLRAGVYPAEYVGGTGAGDAFDAGFIMGMLEGEDPEGCVRWGAALGASCVRSVSATDGVFSRPEAEAFMRENTI